MTFKTKMDNSAMMTLLGRTLIICAIPKAVDAVYDLFFEPTNKPINPKNKTLAAPKKQKKIAVTKKVKKNLSSGNAIGISAGADATRFTEKFGKTKSIKVAKSTKKHDMTKFTQADYDYIIISHEDFLEKNRSMLPHKRKGMLKLRDQLNKDLNTNKSMTSFSNIYLGHIKRKDLPKA